MISHYRNFALSKWMKDWNFYPDVDKGLNKELLFKFKEYDY